MGMQDYVRTAIGNFLNWALPDELPAAQKAMLERLAQARDYAAGRQRPQLKVKPLQADDNIVINFMGLVIERSISMLFGKGITFDLPGEDDTAEAEFIDATWKANRQGIFLHKVAQFGSTYGTCYVKMIPGGLTVRGQQYTRLVALHPLWMTIECAPEDMERVDAYIVRYVITVNGKQVARKEVIRRILTTALNEKGEVYQTPETAYWTISNYYADQSTNGRWVEMEGSPVDWEYDFPPVHHWQNLPDAESCYGCGDIADVIPIQDRYNFTSSNISKIIRYHAHPKTWGRGLGAAQNTSWGPDEMILAQSENATIANLEMQSDLASSRAFSLDMRQAIFDITRTVDLSSMADKLGALTNFGLRVLYQDALSKNGTKRELYGEGLTELNRRLLILAGASPEQADPGVVVWPDPLPVNETEQSAALKSDVELELVSKQTASGKRGYDWTTEEERIAGQQQAGDNVGAAILRAFGQGQQ